MSLFCHLWVASLLFLVMSSHISAVWHSCLDVGHCPGEHMELGPGLTYNSLEERRLHPAAAVSTEGG